VCERSIPQLVLLSLVTFISSHFLSFWHFYFILEWKEVAKKRTPHFIYLPDGPINVAMLIDKWQDKRTCSMLNVASGKKIAPIFFRYCSIFLNFLSLFTFDLIYALILCCLILDRLAIAVQTQSICKRFVIDSLIESQSIHN
jgi:hypothetical protein